MTICTKAFVPFILGHFCVCDMDDGHLPVHHCPRCGCSWPPSGEAVGSEVTAVVEYAVPLKSGVMQVRPNDPMVERFYPLERWLENQERVESRLVIVIDDWFTVKAPAEEESDEE